MGQYKEPPFGYHSLRFAGTIGPDFKYNVVSNEGVTVPLGKFKVYRIKYLNFRAKCSLS